MNTHHAPGGDRGFSAIAPVNGLRPGIRLQEYEIRAVIGEGGFGIVYLAFDTLLEREVAIKEYLPVSLATRRESGQVEVRTPSQRELFDKGLRSFVAEAQILAKFKHPALVEVLRFWEANGTAYMVMPYYRGRTLREIVQREGAMRDEAALLRILLPLLQGLARMHAVKCYHRDISSDNILLLESGEPVLLDFGAARSALMNQGDASTIILKPGFAPIEQYSGDEGASPQGPWTDLYALSAVAYQMITTEMPSVSVARMMRDPMKPLVGRDLPGFSRELLATIDAGLAVDPVDRPQSVAAFERLLTARAEPPPPNQEAAPVSATPTRPQAGEVIRLETVRARSEAAGERAATPAAVPEPVSDPVPASPTKLRPAPGTEGSTGQAPTARESASAVSMVGPVELSSSPLFDFDLPDEPPSAPSSAARSASPVTGASARPSPAVPDPSAAMPSATSARGASGSAASPSGVGATASGSAAKRSAPDAKPSEGAIAGASKPGRRAGVIALAAGVALLLLVSVAVFLRAGGEEAPNPSFQAERIDAPVLAVPESQDTFPPVDAPADGTLAGQLAQVDGAWTAPPAVEAPATGVPAVVSTPLAEPSVPDAPTAGAGSETAPSGSVPEVPAQLDLAALPFQPMSEVATVVAGSEDAAAAAGEGATEDAEVEVATTGVVEVVVRPWGNVFVNGRMVGTVPPRVRVTLPVGPAEIEIRNETHLPHVVKINVEPGKTSRINHEFVTPAPAASGEGAAPDGRLAREEGDGNG
ncbi:MAG: protein kinase domain-containing protein [Rhodocyclaceae bacterium]